MELVRGDQSPSTSSNPPSRPNGEENLDIQLCQTPTPGKEAQKGRRVPTQKVKNKWFHGWRFTLFLAFIAGLIVLFFNAGFLIYCFTHRENGQHLNTTLFEGDCTKSHNIGIVFHLVINILSTTLLSASNFGMQCLAAPSRQDIDKAHEKGDWMDIGVPSVRNLPRVPIVRLFLWLLLAFSSLPFHLIYNSAVYSTTSATSYDIFAGPGDLGEKRQSDLNLTERNIDTIDGSFVVVSFEGEYDLYERFFDLFSAAKDGDLQRLNNQECVDAFEVPFQEVYSKLLLVTDDVKGNSDTYAYMLSNYIWQPADDILTESTPYDWLCVLDSAHSSETRCKSYNDYEAGWTARYSPLANFTVMRDDEIEYKVQYCLAQKAQQYCKLKYSLLLVIIVIAVNLIKTTILLFVWIKLQNAPILTIGDAIASFLQCPDPHSESSCLLSRDLVEAKSVYAPSGITFESDCQPKAFDPSPKKWKTAASACRWTFAISFAVLAVVTCIVLLVVGARKHSGSNPWKQDIGSAESRALIHGDDWPSSLIGNVLIANSAQLVFSFTYFAFNSLLSSMTLAAEWSSYANERKGLRVSSNPQNSQRSNYFLSIPYRYGVPLMLVSILLHWLISQSIFLVGIEAWNSNGKRMKTFDFITCGWSSVGILSTIIVGTGFLLGISGLSLRRLKSGMPVAGSCSLAIAAACHPNFNPNFQNRNEATEGNTDVRSEDEEMAFLPVQWGAVIINGPVGHCSFTSCHVDTPRTTEILYQ